MFVEPFKKLPNVLKSNINFSELCEEITDYVIKANPSININDTGKNVSFPNCYLYSSVFEEKIKEKTKSLLNHAASRFEYIQKEFEIAKVNALLLLKLDESKEKAQEVGNEKRGDPRYQNELIYDYSMPLLLTRLAGELKDEDVFEIKSDGKSVKLPLLHLIFPLFSGLGGEQSAHYISSTWPQVEEELPKFYGLFLLREKLIAQENYYLTANDVSADDDDPLYDYLMKASEVALLTPFHYYKNYLKTENDKIVATKSVRPEDLDERFERYFTYEFADSASRPFLEQRVNVAFFEYILNFKDEGGEFDRTKVGEKFLLPERELDEEFIDDYEEVRSRLIAYSSKFALENGDLKP